MKKIQTFFFFLKNTSFQEQKLKSALRSKCAANFEKVYKVCCRRVKEKHWPNEAMLDFYSEQRVFTTSNDYCKNASRLRAFVPETGARPVGMGLPRAAWVKLNRLRTGVGRCHSSMHKWGLAPSPNCECGASEQTADHVLTACPTHWAPHGARGLTVLDDETRCWLNDITASI